MAQMAQLTQLEAKSVKSAEVSEQIFNKSASNAGTMDETSDLTLRAQNKETRIRFGANRRRKNYRMRKARGISPASRTGKCKSAESAKQIFREVNN